jgi:ParB family chromosome partitioning protein
MAKAKKRQAMGRGLSALLPTEEHLQSGVVEGRILEIPLEQIEVNPNQPRTQFNPEKISELAASIAELGVIQPITVRKMDNKTYQLVSGERRFRAAQSINMERIPAYVRVANDQESLEMALVENIQRVDLDPIEIALSYDRLINEINLTQDNLSKRVGKKRSTVTNYLRLLNLDPIIQSGIRDGFISMGHGRALLAVENRQEQLNLYKRIVATGMSVRATEKAAQSNTSTQPSKQFTDFTKNELDAFSEFFGASVKTTVDKSGGGKIIIPFGSEKEFKIIRKKLDR